MKLQCMNLLRPGELFYLRAEHKRYAPGNFYLTIANDETNGLVVMALAPEADGPNVYKGSSVQVGCVELVSAELAGRVEGYAARRVYDAINAIKYGKTTAEIEAEPRNTHAQPRADDDLTLRVTRVLDSLRAITASCGC